MADQILELLNSCEANGYKIDAIVVNYEQFEALFGPIEPENCFFHGFPVYIDRDKWVKTPRIHARRNQNDFISVV